MCDFWISRLRKKVSASTLKRLLRALSVAAEGRGTDATGISYVNNGNIVTFKKAKPAHKVKLYFPKDTTAVIGHTRFTTQGREKQLPDTAIETDSYIAVQLIEHENVIDSNSIKAMAESVQGSFVFTILRDDNTLFLVKGDNPITLLHYPELGLYIYASTTAILTAALKAVKFSGVCEEVPINDGNIIRIDSDGKLSVSTFEAQVQHFDWHYLYRLYGYDYGDMGEDYTNDLLMICGCYGVAREDVELLLELGYTTDEIEEMLLDSDLFEQTMKEVKTLYQR